MFCPLLVIALQTTPQAAVSDTTCRGSDCAWWDRGWQRCLMLSLAIGIEVGLAHLEHIAAKQRS